MTPIPFHPEDAAYLAVKARGAAIAARELVSFWSEEPELAGNAAVEVLALEAKSILSGGAAGRVVSACRSPRPSVDSGDLDAVFRLDTIATLSAARLAGLGASLEGEAVDAPINRLGGIVSMAATVLGIVKTIF